MEERAMGRVLVVAGSDSGGGAGIQADVKTITVLGGYAATAVTALTAQNTLGVSGVVKVPPDFVMQQMEVVLRDIGADAVKTGMLVDAETIRAVARAYERWARGAALIVDPVMVAKGGQLLLDPSAQGTLLDRLLPLASLVTPNVSEARALTGLSIESPSDLERAADRLLSMGLEAVLVKGGHLASEIVVDLLRTADGDEVRLEAPRIDTRHTHGTGCTLASAIATGVAEGLRLSDAVRRAHAYVQRAIATAPGFGKGHGPLNHAVHLEETSEARGRSLH
ncbi:MAG TPA: bifunctional hydroxymethylpyrimidine kinase/phosphomethylpyrimidine kinase [Polyangiaceae bacterium]